MEMTPTAIIPVRDASHVAEARRLAAAAAAPANLSSTDSGNLAIIVTELATNLLKHAGGGTLLVNLRAVPAKGSRVDVYALDNGPGIANVARCLEDGYSTAGTPGHGLGAVRRLSASLDIYSVPGKGSAVLAVLEPRATDERDQAIPLPRFLPTSISVAMKGENVCGDLARVTEFAGRCLVLVVDGLGHGNLAAEAAASAVPAFDRSLGDTLRGMMQAVHDALRSTRGAAAAIADIDPARGVVKYCGIGNIAAAVLTGPDTRRMVSHNGTAGTGTPRITEFSYPWTSASVLVMHSDGIQSRWDLSAYPGLLARSSELLAAVLYRDFDRGRDDATVVALRERQP